MKTIFAFIAVAALMSSVMATGPAGNPASGGAGVAGAPGHGAATAPSASGTAPAPGPASAAVSDALPAVGSLLGTTVVTFFAYYSQ